jgi:hypothetical protein
VQIDLGALAFFAGWIEKKTTTKNMYCESFEIVYTYTLD